MSFAIAPKWVTLPSGIQLYSERITKPDAAGTPTQTIICLHGLTATVNLFYGIYDTIISSLPNVQILAYDTSGTGLSPAYAPRLQAELTVQHLIEDFEAFVELEAPTGPIVVLAHSASTTLISRFLATSSPLLPRISHVVMMGGPMEAPLPADVAAQRFGIADLIGGQGVHVIVDALLPTFAGPTSVKTRPTALAHLRGMFLSQQPQKEGQAAVVRASVTGASTALEYEKFPEGTKVLILGGEEDVLAPKDTIIKIANEIKNSKLVWLKEVGHCPTVESPVEAAEAIVAFVKE